MTRHERRRREREIFKKEAVYNMTDAQIRTIKNKASNEAVAQSVILMVAFPLTVLHKNGWEPEQLEYLAEAIIEEYNAFADDERSIQDYAKFIFEVTGMKFSLDKPNTADVLADRKLP